MPEVVAAPRANDIPLSKSEPGTVLWSRYAIVIVTLLIVTGFGLRLSGLGDIAFAQDEINKLDAVRSYDRGDFSANAEHPMLMKVLMDVSLRGARAWNGLTGSSVTDEAALRLPNVVF